MRYVSKIAFMLGIVSVLVSPRDTHAQTYPQISGNDFARECTIALKPDGNGTHLVAAYYEEGLIKNVKTKKGTTSTSTTSWSTTETPMDKSPDGSAYADLRDEKLAYRNPGSSPELLMVYRVGKAGAEGTFLSFSTDDGSTWSSHSSTPKTLELMTNSDGHTTRRPVIATDITSQISGKMNNAYIAWTIKNGTVNDASNAVMVCTVSAGSYTKSTPVTIYAGSSTVEVDVCDMGVSQDGTVYLLWRQTDVTTHMRSLFIATLPNNSTTWSIPTTPFVSSSPQPSSVDLGFEQEYQDYPCMTISTTDCSSEKLFVAYTQKPASTSANGQSDLFLIKTALPLPSSPTWVSATSESDGNVDADGVTHADAVNYASYTNTASFLYQFEPQLAPDGQDGVFLLYYSAQETGLLAHPQQPCATIFETGAHGGQRSISTLSNTATARDVSDYAGIIWNPILYLAHAVWTDPGASGAPEVFGGNITSSPLQGPSGSIPDVGDLGFSNQRRIVMTGNKAHIVGIGGPGSGSTDKPHAIWYSEQSANPSGTITNWLPPLQISDDLNSEGGEVLSTQPVIGVYEHGGPNPQKAIAVVWGVEDRAGVDGTQLYIRVKEFKNCDAGDISDWSPIISGEVLSLSRHPNGVIPTVAPLTSTISGTTDRNLIGWVITFPSTLGQQMLSVTLLRGPQTGSGVRLYNERWREYSDLNIVPTVGYNSVTPNMGTWFNSHAFVSSTSNESKGNGFSPANTGDITHEVVFTGDGLEPATGAWVVKNVTYNTSGAQLGELSTVTPPKQISSPKPKPPFGFLPSTVSYDRNPSITITSTGQKLASWEHIDGFLLPTISSQILFPGGCIYPDENSSSIRMAQTDKSGTWSPIKDAITDLALDVQFRWLLNPSETAFPKTHLTDATNAYSDEDPGAAEMLYWQHNKLVPGPACTYSVSTVDKLHERQFVEPKGDNHSSFQGKWNTVDPVGGSPVWPSSGIGISGVNAQRSFGIYNTGPQYHWTSSLAPNDLRLYRDAPPASDLYINGLSYGIGNDPPVSGVKQYTIASATADIGALKGTYDTALGVDLYRSELRVKDSRSVIFKWGKIYVEDTTLASPIREVMLHDGHPDSMGFASHNAMRDSIFATEWFNWPVSAQIRYDRSLLAPQRGYWVDTILSTIIDSTTYYDTVPRFHPDSLNRDSSFHVTGLHMKYTVELVHSNGHIDTVEQMDYAPYSHLNITPLTVHIDNAGSSADTVMLRVRGDFANVPDDDSLVEFTRETMLGLYQTYGDTTIAVGTGGGFVTPSGGSCLTAIGPYPTPSAPNAGNVSILVHYCSSGFAITAQVYNVSGAMVGPTVTFTSDGQLWDRLAIPAPSMTGAYYIHVSVGGSTTVLPYTVF